jgi:hypothetical protein
LASQVPAKDGDEQGKALWRSQTKNAYEFILQNAQLWRFVCLVPGALNFCSFFQLCSLSQFRSTSELTFIVKGHGMGGMGMETCQLWRDQGDKRTSVVARSDGTLAPPNNGMHNWMFRKLLMIFMS